METMFCLSASNHGGWASHLGSEGNLEDAATVQQPGTFSTIVSSQHGGDQSHSAEKVTEAQRGEKIAQRHMAGII
jgi:hypothetical protein